MIEIILQVDINARSHPQGNVQTTAFGPRLILFPLKYKLNSELRASTQIVRPATPAVRPVDFSTPPAHARQNIGPTTVLLTRRAVSAIAPT